MLDYLVKEDWLFYAIFVFVIVYSLKIYSESDVFNLKCVVSGVDGNRYCVRNRLKLDESADLLARVTQNAKKFIDKLYAKYPSKANVKRLKDGFNPDKIQETLPTSELTAYSENKGEKIAFCLARTKNSERLVDEGTLTFVCYHELAHVMTKSIGHKKEFWDNFKFLLVEAKEMKMYDPVDYKKNNQTYCGMTISDNPYYDV
jgi:hypothetical protein